MTRLFLAAGVAALAIATPLAAKPGGGGGGHDNGGGAPAQAGGGGHGHGGGGAPAFNPGGGGHGHGGGGFAAPRPQQVQRQQMRAFNGGGGNGHGFAAPQQRVERQQMRGVQRQQAHNVEQRQARNAQHQQARNLQQQQREAWNASRPSSRRRRWSVNADLPASRLATSNGTTASSTSRHGWPRASRLPATANSKSGNRSLRDQQVGAERFGGGRNLNGKQARLADRQVAQQSWNESRFSP